MGLKIRSASRSRARVNTGLMADRAAESTERHRSVVFELQEGFRFRPILPFRYANNHFGARCRYGVLIRELWRA